MKSGCLDLAKPQHHHLPAVVLGMLEKCLYICLSSQDGVHISESVFASSSGNSQFQRQKDGDNYFRSCIGYAVCPGSQDRTPYQAECGVLSEVYFCQGPAKPPEEYAEEGSTLLLLFL